MVVCAARQQGRRPHRAPQPPRARGAPAGTETSHALDTAWCSPVPGILERLPVLTPASARPRQVSASTQTHRFWKIPVTETRQGTLVLEVPVPLGLTPGQGLPSGENLGWGFQHQMPY